MGFEYLIHVTVSDKEKEEIRKLLDFDDSNETWGDVIEFEEDGIYICKHQNSDLWTGLEALKSFLEKNKLDYNIEEL